MEFIAPVIIANMAGLLKYLCRVPKLKIPVLPDLKGSLSEKVLSSLIELTNSIVHNILDKKKMLHGKCGEYLCLISTQKFLMGKRAAEDRVTAMNKKLLNDLQLVKFANFFPPPV